MATERLKTVRPSGGDYTSLAAAIAGEAGNLVSADEWLHIECYAMIDTVQAIINGYTTSSDCHILIDVPMSERHQGVWNDNKYNIRRAAANQNLSVGTSHTYIEGLQSINTLGWSQSNDAFYVDSNAASVFISKCIGSAATLNGFRRWSTTAHFYNCLALNCSVGFSLRSNAAIYNCNAINCTTGFEKLYLSCDAYNCLAANCSTADFASTGVGDFSLYNCASSDATAGAYAGSGNRVNQTFSFVDAANGNFALAEGDTGARGYGLTNPGSGLYFDDILGNPRTAPWDIGAFQYVSGEGPISKKKQYFYLQNMRG